MTSRSPLVSHASTILDQVSMRAASAASWNGVQALSVVFVASLTAAASQLSVPLPFTPVPFTMQPLVVLVGAAVLGSRLGALAQILYLMAGLAGMPVFAFSPELPHGLLRLLGPTGGYLMAYPLAAFATGWLAERGFDRRYLTSILAMAVGLSVIFAGGVAWIAAGAGLSVALATGLYPFVVVDIVKIVAAGLVLPSAWTLLQPKD
jgi:biotin transport system substrate-specific component